MWPRLIIIMQYLTKKECSSLLALLGEESLRACRERREQNKFVGVSWVGSHIVTIEAMQGQLLVRVTAVFHQKYENDVEEKMHEAAMRESGYYQFSSRELSGFSLAEITVYGVPENSLSILQQEIEAMCNKLDHACQ